MKNRNYLIYSTLMMLFLLAGCSKDLEEKPLSFLSPEQFFATEQQCIQAANGAYSTLPGLFGTEQFWKTLEVGTDLMISKEPLEPTRDYTFSAGAPGASSSVWNQCYAGIKNANLVISKLGTAPKISEAMRTRLIGEVKYLRALQYYILSNTFGDVPMWTNELDLTEVSKLPRTPVAQVRTQIIADLIDASNSLPLSYAAADVGRATKGAALGLIAKVYLFEKDWVNAQKYAQMVVDLNQYQLINYANLFDILNKFKNNKESVFEIQYKRDVATNTNIKTNYYSTYFLPFKDGSGGTYAGVNFGTTVMLSFEVLYPSTVMVAMFEPNDKRRDVILATGYNGQTFNKFPANKAGRPWFGPKFWDLEENNKNSGKNLYFMRYAEILLILAEAMNEQLNTACITHINKVRADHGGLPGVSYTNQAAIRDLIMKERTIEFVGEFSRKWDLFRTKKIVDAVKSVANDSPLGAANIKEIHNIFPIPQLEIDKNPNLLPNNPGY